MNQQEINLHRAMITAKANGFGFSYVWDIFMRKITTPQNIEKLEAELDAAQAVIDNA